MPVINERDPVRQFEALLASSSFVILLYYRGHWCPFCISHLKELVAISGEVKAAGGMVAAATAEGPEHLEKLRASTGLADTVIIDPENLLAKGLKDKGVLDVAVSDSRLYRLPGYKHGLAQPALLAIKNDGTVLYQWAIIPSLMNIGGATDRPVLAEVWKNVQRKLQGEDGTEEKCATTGILHLLKQKTWGR
ncbi:hypothetical protein VTI74DRAFT_5113 [Chaetomium olivicolor]